MVLLFTGCPDPVTFPSSRRRGQGQRIEPKTVKFPGAVGGALTPLGGVCQHPACLLLNYLPKIAQAQRMSR